MKNKLGSFVVADPSKCTGCRACEVACFTSHNANNNVVQLEQLIFLLFLDFIL